MRLIRVILVAVASLLAIAPRGRADGIDPAQNLARVRLIVVSRARTTAITIAGPALASYVSTILAGPAGSRSTQLGHTLQVYNAAADEAVEAQFDMILAGVVTPASVTWHLSTDTGGAETDVEVYSLNTLGSPRLVDRFTTNATSADFVTSDVLLDSHGQVMVSPLGPRLVLAHYYPWYTLDTWRDPQLIDQPAKLYASDNQSDVDAQAAQAHAAGIDAFVVSWQGKDAGGGFNDRRMRVVLEAARRAGMHACVYTETLVANSAADPEFPTDPATMLLWLEQIVDLYGNDPAYLRMGDRPVIFIYQSWQIAQSDWDDLRARLRATGRDPFLVGDFYHSRLLEVFDGEYQYSNVTQTAQDLHDIDLVETLRVRTFNLLRPTDRRRLWIASVAPGYDDTHLSARTSHIVIDRAGGRTYDTQWLTAIETASDWVILTTWNEWWENTGIEPSRLYGATYLDLTHTWTQVFKGPSARRRPASVPTVGYAQPRGR